MTERLKNAEREIAILRAKYAKIQLQDITGMSIKRTTACGARVLDGLKKVLDRIYVYDKGKVEIWRKGWKK